MSELPENWRTSRIGEVADVNPRTQKDELDDETLASFVPMKCVEAESGRFSPPENKKVGEVKKGYTPMRDGDVIFAKVTPCMENGKAAVVRGLTNGIGFGSTEFYAFRPKDNLMSEFLFYYIIQQGFRREAERHMTGAVGLRRVPRAFIEEHDIPLPPLPEQRRIVARIEELFSRLDAGVAALRHAKAQLQRYRQSVLAAAVTGELTQEWREQHPDTEPGDVLRRFLLETRPHDWTGKYSPPIAPAIEKRCEIPDAWTWMSTDELIREPLKNGLSLKGFTEPPGVAVLKLDALNENGLDYSKRQYLRTDSPKVAEIQIEKGDFLISRGNGSLRLLAKGVIAEVVPDNVIYPDTMIRFRFPSAVQRWIAIAWRSCVLREQIETRAKSTAGIYKIAQGDLRPIAIPIPPLAEQQQIVAEVEARTAAIDHLEAELDRQITRSNRLRQSVLQTAYSGQL